ncbi:MAG: HAD hydrolase-like protein [Planctomycetota bacterium]|nr:HAD hydrolase-like protein [Planctomycetota bacterium]
MSVAAPSPPAGPARAAHAARSYESGYGALARTLARAARGKELIGFDVFDTLLRRRIEPETIKDLVAKHLADHLREMFPGRFSLPGGSPLWELVRERRRRLEVDLGHAAERAGDDHEFRLRELIHIWIEQCMPEALRADAMLAQRVLRHELKLEQAATLPAPGIEEVLQRASEGGRRLIFVSDSYLDERDVRGLLQHHALLQYFAAGYVSSTSMRTKRSGRLFDLVLERENIAPSRMLFVGDNPYSDGDSPRARGINTLRIRDSREGARRSRLQLLERLSRQSRAWAGELEREVVHTGPAAFDSQSSCPHYRLGLLLAPSFIAFTRHIIEHAREKGLRRVFFLSREGHMFMRMYRRLVDAMGLRDVAPPAAYLVASRASTFLPSLDSLEPDQIDRIWWQYSNQSILQLLRNLGLPFEVFVPHATRCGFVNLVEPIRDLRGHEALQRFVLDDDVRRDFALARDRARGMLLRYLASKGWFPPSVRVEDYASSDDSSLSQLASSHLAANHPASNHAPGDAIGLIDIGWKGSIQNNLFRAARHVPGAPIIDGIYFALSHVPHDEHPANLKHGYLADTRSGDWTQECIFKNGPVFEMFSTAHHSSPEAYRQIPTSDGGTRVRPVLLREKAEEENFSTNFAEVRRGIREYFAQHMKVAALLDHSAADIRPHVLDQLRRYILYPTRREARAFLEYSHVENFGVFKVSDYHFKGSWRKILFSRPASQLPFRLLHELRQQLWPEAICRRSPVPLANFVYDLIETRRACKHG